MKQPEQPPRRRVKVHGPPPPAPKVIDGQATLDKKRPFVPVDPLAAMMGPHPLVHGVILRQLADMDGQSPAIVVESALDVLNRLQAGFQSGGDISSLAPQVSLHMSNQAEKADLIVGLANAHDLERLTRFLNSRHDMETFVLGCMQRKDLTTMEALALSSYIKGELEGITGRLRKEVRQEPSKDTDEIMKRASVNSMQEQKGLQQKFNAASPQEREILRKLGFKAKKILAARVTKTVTTTTTEVVQKQ